MGHKRSLSIFILENDLFCGAIYERHIANLGYEKLRLFMKVEECLNNLNENPDVIFIDYQLATADSMVLLQKIGRVNPNIYLVVISAEEEIKITDALLKHGVFECICKGTHDLEAIETVLRKINEAMTLLELRPPVIPFT